MNNLLQQKLVAAIKDVFTDDRYQMEKHIPEFRIDGQYAGDCYNQDAFESNGTNPPTFYHFYSPFDVISRKAGYRALMYKAGQELLNIDFLPYVPARTGIMSPLILKSLGVQQLQGPILFVGTGTIACEALRAFKALFPDLREAAYVNLHNEAPQFSALAQELGVTVTPGDVTRIGDYCYIICHSSAKKPVLVKEYLPHIAKDAFIATFASEDSCEVAEEYFDTAEATVITDWASTLNEAAELKRAIEQGRAQKDAIVYLKDVFKAPLVKRGRYTIYRSHGTPMQNVAVLKALND